MDGEDERQFRERQGFWLRMARERAGKSQRGAAEFLGMSARSKSTISDYENGVTPPSLRTLRKLAGWYGVPLRTFTEPESTAFDRLNEIAAEAIAEAVLTTVLLPDYSPRMDENGPMTGPRWTLRPRGAQVE